MADDKPTEAAVFDEDVFEEGEPQEAQTIHRIRANSTIMQLKKILGESTIRDLGPMASKDPMDLETWLTLAVLFCSRQPR